MAPTSGPDVRHNPDQHRYEAQLDDEPAGFTAYLLGGGTITFTHTEVDPAFEGNGVGSAIARFALDDVRAAGDRTVIAQCLFIKAWIERHPEYQD
jgi:predicted GNAT family acetyltransferase